MNEMFREIVPHSARILDLVIGAVSTMAVLMKTNRRLTRPWELTLNARSFERELMIRKAYNEWQGRMPVAR